MSVRALDATVCSGGAVNSAGLKMRIPLAGSHLSERFIERELLAHRVLRFVNVSHESGQPRVPVIKAEGPDHLASMR